MGGLLQQDVAPPKDVVVRTLARYDYPTKHKWDTATGS
jgi:hypothetical protein